MSQSQLPRPRTGSRSSQSSAGASSSRTSTPAKRVSQSKEFSLPAFSCKPCPPTAKDMEKRKLKTIRRNAPPGEDQKGIKRIIKGVKNQSVTVQEFIALVTPYTGDSGATLRAVTNDDLASFRKLARKVYEMITQDNSDVLLNQQMDLNQYYSEKKSVLNHKMMKAIEEIFTIAPDFDFERYHKEKDQYLAEVLPIPDELALEPEELEMMKRQQAYHRLQWLRSEGERLTTENNRLKKRLIEMKQLYNDENQRGLKMERAAEIKRTTLEAAEAQQQEKLEELYHSLEKTVIDQERSMRQKADQDVLQPKMQESQDLKKKKNALRKRKFSWSEQTARELDYENISQYKQGEASKLGKKPSSPFHYSPPKTPPQEEFENSGCGCAEPQISTGRRGSAPRDSWGGF